MARIISYCRVGADRFAVDLAQVAGIEGTDLLQRTPGEAGGDRATAEVGWLLGAHEDLPVHSLARLLGRPDAERAPRGSGVVLVVAGLRGGPRGVLVDSIEHSEQPPEAIHPLPRVFSRLGGAAAFGGVVQRMGALSLLVELGALVVGEKVGGGPDQDLKDGKDIKNNAELSDEASVRPASRVLIADLLARSAEGHPVSIALAAGQVAEVIAASPVVPVPGTPADLPGMILWRDSPLPVLDLARGLSGAGRLVASDMPAARFVVAAAGPFHVAIPVGREVRFERLPLPARPIPLPPGLADSEVLGAYDFAGTLLLVFDVSRSLARTDRP